MLRALLNKTTPILTKRQFRVAWIVTKHPANPLNAILTLMGDPNWNYKIGPRKALLRLRAETESRSENEILTEIGTEKGMATGLGAGTGIGIETGIDRETGIVIGGIARGTGIGTERGLARGTETETEKGTVQDEMNLAAVVETLLLSKNVQ